jgi:hypothetical protein
MGQLAARDGRRVVRQGEQAEGGGLQPPQRARSSVAPRTAV